MANVKPNEFPMKPFINGSEEVYTQKPSGNYKYNLSTAIDYISIGVDQWESIELVLTPSNMGVSINILDENLLGINEYYEIHKVIIMYDFGTIAYDQNSSIRFRFLDNINAYIYNFFSLSKSFFEEPDSFVYYFHPQIAHEPYSRNTGFYLEGTDGLTIGDGTITIRVYYKISS
jgi:hypothetical protein